MPSNNSNAQMIKQFVKYSKKLMNLWKPLIFGVRRKITRSVSWRQKRQNWNVSVKKRRISFLSSKRSVVVTDRSARNGKKSKFSRLRCDRPPLRHVRYALKCPARFYSSASRMRSSLNLIARKERRSDFGFHALMP